MMIKLAQLGSNMLNQTGQSANIKAVGVETIVSLIIQSILGILGVIFLVLMVYGGVLWMNARGNEDYVSRAKDTIINSIIGLIITLASYALSIFILKAIFGATS